MRDRKMRRCRTNHKTILARALALALMTAGMATPALAEDELEGPGAFVTGQIQTPYPADPSQYGPGAALAGKEDKAPFLSQAILNPIVIPVETYGYDQMVQDIQNLQNTYGSLMQANVIGTSVDGRNLYEIVVGNPNAGKHVLIQAAMHGRESMTPLLAMKQLEYALAFYHTGSYGGQSLENMFNQVAVHFVPMVNPDGVSLSQYGISSVRSDALRQNVMAIYEADKANGRTTAELDLYLRYWKANINGVDINSNFDANWATIGKVGFPSYSDYKGPSAVSEPETAAMVNLANQRPWSAVVNYHSMGQVIYWDFPVNNTRDASMELANQVSGATGYRLLPSNGGGGFKDWLQCKSENPAPSVTVEVGGVSCPLPFTEWEGVWAQNKSVWALTMEFAQNR